MSKIYDEFCFHLNLHIQLCPCANFGTFIKIWMIWLFLVLIYWTAIECTDEMLNFSVVQFFNFTPDFFCPFIPFCWEQSRLGVSIGHHLELGPHKYDEFQVCWSWHDQWQSMVWFWILVLTDFSCIIWHSLQKDYSIILLRVVGLHYQCSGCQLIQILPKKARAHITYFQFISFLSFPLDRQDISHFKTLNVSSRLRHTHR